MGRAGWHDLTRSKDGESKSEGAANGIESAVSDAREVPFAFSPARQLSTARGRSAPLKP